MPGPLAAVYNRAIATVGDALGFAVKHGAAAGALHFPFVTQALSMLPFAGGYKLRHAVYARCMERVGAGTIIHHGVRFDDIGQSIGDDVWISAGCYIELADIGDHVLIGPHAMLLAGGSNHRHDRTDVPIKQQGNVPRVPIKIGDGAWIGAGAIVMADVGHDAIVGAGAVVVKAVPPFAVVVGNPARVVRSRLAAEAAKP